MQIRTQSTTDQYHARAVLSLMTAEPKKARGKIHLGQCFAPREDVQALYTYLTDSQQEFFADVVILDYVRKELSNQHPMLQILAGQECGYKDPIWVQDAIGKMRQCEMIDDRGYIRIKSFSPEIKQNIRNAEYALLAEAPHKQEQKLALAAAIEKQYVSGVKACLHSGFDIQDPWFDGAVVDAQKTLGHDHAVSLILANTQRLFTLAATPKKDSDSDIKKIKELLGSGYIAPHASYGDKTLVETATGAENYHLAGYLNQVLKNRGKTLSPGG